MALRHRAKTESQTDRQADRHTDMEAETATEMNRLADKQTETEKKKGRFTDGAIACCYVDNKILRNVFISPVWF